MPVFLEVVVDERRVSITPRERDVLVALCRPLGSVDPFPQPASSRAIASELSVSEAAVKQHLVNLRRERAHVDASQSGDAAHVAWTALGLMVDNILALERGLPVAPIRRRATCGERRDRLRPWPGDDVVYRAGAHRGGRQPQPSPFPPLRDPELVVAESAKASRSAPPETLVRVCRGKRRWSGSVMETLSIRPDGQTRPASGCGAMVRHGIPVLQGPTVISLVTANSSLQFWVETGPPSISVTVQLAAAG
jgi:hypothetical protein